MLTRIEPHNFRNREWRRILKRAGIGPRKIKDLRDTFASHLLSQGIPLGYVSRQLGHSDVSVTARHYARWVGDDVYLGEVADDDSLSTRKRGAPGTTRTCDPQVRSLVLYPTELRARGVRMNHP